MRASGPLALHGSYFLIRRLRNEPLLTFGADFGAALAADFVAARAAGLLVVFVAARAAGLLVVFVVVFLAVVVVLAVVAFLGVAVVVVVLVVVVFVCLGAGLGCAAGAVWLGRLLPYSRLGCAGCVCAVVVTCFGRLL